MRAWTDLVGMQNIMSASEKNKDGKIDYRELIVSTLHTEGFVIISHHLASALLMNHNLIRELYLPSSHVSFTTHRFCEVSKALIKSIQVL